MSGQPDSTAAQIESLTREVREIRNDIYGNPNIRQKSVFDRLDGLEDKLQELRTTYERERIETSYFSRLEDELDKLRLDYKIAIVYLRGLAGGVGAILVLMIGAAVVGALRLFAGG